MAEIAVSFLLENLATLLHGEANLLSGVRTEIEDLKDELESMTAFLRDADAKADSEEVVKVWVKQVQDVAYETEDVLDEFMLRFAPRLHRHGSIYKLLHKAVFLIRTLGTRHRIGNHIKKIKTKVLGIKERRERYNISSQGSSAPTRNYTWHGSDDLELVVGIEKPKQELIELLLDGELRRTAVSVVGFGGSGKTTLIKKVYDDERVRLHFEYRVWIPVLEKYNNEELLGILINNLCKAREEPLPQGINTIEELLGEIRDKLQQRRYVIVFDDLWRISLWDCVQNALPDSNCGSKIIVTTRNQPLPHSHVYNLQPLPSDKAWELFCKKAFPSGICPTELEGMSQDILRICEGLPLAIVVIGGLLSTKDKTLIEWRKLRDSLGLELERNSLLSKLSGILSQSYKDLPYYLKSCFLYFNIFPENHLISCIRLFRLWIAEGFIQEETGQTLEDVAEGYLKELIQRNLIQMGERDVSGQSRSCRVHNLLRVFILSKSKEDNFSTEQNTTPPDKIRRLLIHNRSDENVPQVIASRLRSALVFGIDELNPPSSSLNTFFYGYRLLRILDLEGVPLESFPNELASLFHLRFLSLRKTKIKRLPKSLGKLRYLETLDLKQTFVSELPIEILKLHRLRHLLVYRYETLHPFGMNVPEGIGNLKALQKLAFIDAAQATNVIKELGNLSQLRRLGIVNLRREDGINLCASMAKMRDLRSFDFSSVEEIIDLESLSSPPEFLQRLCIKGQLTKLPHWFASLPSISSIYLRHSKMQEDPIRTLQALPNLVHLVLNQAYTGEILRFEAGGFQKLKRLEIVRLEGLKSMIAEQGAMSNLQELHIRECNVLQMVPLGIEHLVNLKEFYLYDMPREFMKKLQGDDNNEDFQRVRHIPLICHFIQYGRPHWLVQEIT